MKTTTVRQLADKIGISVDTLRHYREVGLLNPKQSENGYYMYTPQDALTILYMRELRGQNLSIKMIESTLSFTSIMEYQEILHQQQYKIQHNLEMSQLALERIVETKKYIDKGVQLLETGCVEVYKGAKTFTLCPIGREGFYNGSLAGWTEHFPFTYVAILISPQEIQLRKDYEPYQVRLGCGALERYANRFSLPKDTNIVSHPAAQYARICVRVRNPFHLTPNDIAPLLNYAKIHNVCLEDGVGGRLIFVENTRIGPVYYLMCWARVGE